MIKDCVTPRSNVDSKADRRSCYSTELMVSFTIDMDGNLVVAADKEKQRTLPLDALS